jgi:phosphoglycolate phosphatase
MPIRAILFDKDGTLVDIQATLGPATCDVLALLSAGDAALFARLAAVTSVDTVARRLLPGCPVISEATDVYGRLWAQMLGRPFGEDFCAEIDRLYLTACLDHLRPVGDPRAVLVGLRERGYALGVMTNDAEANTRAQLRRLDIETLFGFVAGYDSGFGMKPDAAPVLAFARAEGVAPAEIAVIGDSPHDLIAARAAGAVAVGVLSGPNERATLAPHAEALLPSIEQLDGWLSGKLSSG